MSKIKNGGLDEYGPLKTLKCNHLASLGLKGLTTDFVSALCNLRNATWAVRLSWLENAYPHPLFSADDLFRGLDQYGAERFGRLILPESEKSVGLKGLKKELVQAICTRY